MASTSAPKILAFLSDGVIAKGQAVKIGSDSKHIVVVSATTDMSIGIAQSAVSALDAAAGVLVEVAINGGGAKGLAKAGIAAGDIVGHNADGSLQKAAAAHDRVVGIAMEAASAGGIFYVEVALGMATQAQA